MPSILKLTATASLIAVIGASSAFAKDLTEERVNQLIKSYIQEHPQDILDSLQQWQIKEEADRMKEQKKAAEEVMETSFAGDNLHYGMAGNPKGDVTIVEFFDYNCPACKMMFESLDALLKEDKNVRVLFVEYPIFGPQSDENAKLAMAVAKLAPEKYYQYHAAIMNNKGKVSSTYGINVAKNLGLNEDALRKEMAKPIYNEYLQKDRNLGRKLQIKGTPALVINGKVIGSALRLDDLKTQVRWARDDQKKKD